MNLKNYIESATNKLIKSNIETAGLDVKILVSDYLNLEFHELILKESDILIDDEINELDLRVNRRLSGEPVAYIIGYKYFYKSKFFVNNNVLIPRPETELLVEQALSWSEGKEDLKILDMGAGSGCLGQSVLKELPGAHLTSIDISFEATEVAKKNANSLGLSSQIEFLVKDITEIKLNEYLNEYDLILANPPYIDLKDGFVESNVKKYEPNIALFSTEEGFKDILNWTIRAASWLRVGGLYLMEFGDNQSERVKNIFEQNNFFMDLSLHKDYSGLPRFVRAIK